MAGNPESMILGFLPIWSLPYYELVSELGDILVARIFGHIGLMLGKATSFRLLELEAVCYLQQLNTI